MARLRPALGRRGPAASNLVGLDAATLTFLVISSLAAALIARLRSLVVTLRRRDRDRAGQGDGHADLVDLAVPRHDAVRARRPWRCCSSRRTKPATSFARERRERRPRPIARSPRPRDAACAIAVIAALLAVARLRPAAAAELYWIDVLTAVGDLLGRRARARSCSWAASGSSRSDRSRCSRSARGSPRASPSRTSIPFPLVLLIAGADHDGARHARRPAGAAPQRAVPGADHADARRRDHRRPDGDELPQRRPRIPRPHRVVVRQHARCAGRTSPTSDAGVLPLHGDRGRADVRAGVVARALASPAARGRRSARASRPRSPRA